MWSNTNITQEDIDKLGDYDLCTVLRRTSKILSSPSSRINFTLSPILISSPFLSLKPARTVKSCPLVLSISYISGWTFWRLKSPRGKRNIVRLCGHWKVMTNNEHRQKTEEAGRFAISTMWNLWNIAGYVQRILYFSEDSERTVQSSLFLQYLPESQCCQHSHDTSSKIP